jgi:hypothetical protein
VAMVCRGVPQLAQKRSVARTAEPQFAHERRV